MLNVLPWMTLQLWGQGQPKVVGNLSEKDEWATRDISATLPFCWPSLVQGMTSPSRLGCGHPCAMCWLDLQSHNDHWITVITCLEYRWLDTSAVTTYWQPPESLSKCSLIAPTKLCIREKKKSGINWGFHSSEKCNQAAKQKKTKFLKNISLA